LTNIENWINRFKCKFNDRRLIIYVHKKVEDYVINNKKKSLNKFMFRNLMWINIKLGSSLNIDEFKVFSRKQKKDVTNEI
jgi:hypothetical protein